MADRLDRSLCRAQAFRAMLILTRETYAARLWGATDKTLLVILDEAMHCLDEEIAALQGRDHGD